MRILRQNPHSLVREAQPQDISAKEVIWWDAIEEQYVESLPENFSQASIFVNAVPADEVSGSVSLKYQIVGEEGGDYLAVPATLARGALVAGFRNATNYFEFRTFTRTDLHDPHGWSRQLNDAHYLPIATPTFPMETLSLPTSFRPIDDVAILHRRSWMFPRSVIYRAWDVMQLVQIVEGSEIILAETVIPHQFAWFHPPRTQTSHRLSIVRGLGGIATIVGCYVLGDGSRPITPFFIQATVNSEDCGDYCGVKVVPLEQSTARDSFQNIAFRCLDGIGTRFVANSRKPASEENEFGERHSEQSLLAIAVPSEFAGGGAPGALSHFDAAAGESAWSKSWPTLYHGSKASQSVLIQNSNDWPSWSRVSQSPRTKLTLRFIPVFQREESDIWPWIGYNQWLPESLELNAVECGTDLVFSGEFENHIDTSYPLALRGGFINDEFVERFGPGNYLVDRLGPAITAKISGRFVLVVATQFSKRSELADNRWVHEWFNGASFIVHGMMSVFQAAQSFEETAWSLGRAHPDGDGDLFFDTPASFFWFWANNIQNLVTVDGIAGWNTIQGLPGGEPELPESGLWNAELQANPFQVQAVSNLLFANWYRPGSGQGTGAGAGLQPTDPNVFVPKWRLSNYWATSGLFPFNAMKWWIEPN